jgi:hypothetical protein
LVIELRESATNKSASTATGRRERTFGIDNQILTFQILRKSVSGKMWKLIVRMGCEGSHDKAQKAQN